MNELLIIMVFLLGLVQGFSLAYVLYAPDKPFKRGFIDGLTLRFLWRKKK